MSDLTHLVHDVNIMEFNIMTGVLLYILQGVSTGTGVTNYWCSLYAEGKLMCMLFFLDLGTRIL